MSTRRRARARRNKRKAFLYVLIPIVLVAITYVWSSPSTNIPEYLQPATVNRIIDGDTIEVIIDGEGGNIERVRLISIDAPEMGRFGSEEGAEPGAIEARDFVASAIPIGSTVWLEIQGNDRDRFGRLRRIVWFEGVSPSLPLINLNQLLLDEGLTVEMVIG